MSSIFARTEPEPVAEETADEAYARGLADGSREADEDRARSLAYDKVRVAEWAAQRKEREVAGRVAQLLTLLAATTPLAVIDELCLLAPYADSDERLQASADALLREWDEDENKELRAKYLDDGKSHPQTVTRYVGRSGGDGIGAFAAGWFLGGG